MKRVAIVSGTLGLGTAIVFGAAVLAAVLFPNGTTVSGNGYSQVFDKGIAVPAPMPVPVAVPPVIVDKGGQVVSP